MATLLTPYPLYCFVRAIQRRSFLRICFWAFPTFIALRIGSNAVILGARIITYVYLKECGTQLVFYTMNGMKVVCNVSDVK